MIFDTHCHYNDESYGSDREALLRSLPEQGVDRICEIGYNLESSKEAIRLARELFIPGLQKYAVVGFHPENADELTEESLLEIYTLSQEKEVVALGEIGLDYFRIDKRSRVEKEQEAEAFAKGEITEMQAFNPDPEVQKDCFIAMMELARKRNLPVVLHSRDAAMDTYHLLRDHRGYVNGGIVHCFSYPLEVAKQFIDLGMMVGIGGVLTFSNAKKLKQVATEIPLNHIVLETDCPYMSPVPLRGSRNHSGNLRYVVSCLAELKGVSEEEVIRKTTENALQVYRIKD